MKYILLLLFFPCVLHAQLFRGGFVAGLNLTQIDGDLLAGYDKYGMNIGVMADIYLTESFSMSIEILYAQKGAGTGLFHNNNLFLPEKWKWDYIELPLVVHYNDVNNMNFGFGIAPARLVNAQRFVDKNETEGYFDETASPPGTPPTKWDIGGVADLSININTVLKANIRIVYSLASVRQDAVSTRRNQTQRNNAASVRLIFLFNALGQKKV